MSDFWRVLAIMLVVSASFALSLVVVLDAIADWWDRQRD